jgi:hypothetical protein
MDTTNTAERLAAKLKQELTKIIGERGNVIHVATEGLGHGWCVVFDTEYAALKAYHTYRHSKDVQFGESKNLNGWYISVGPTV